MTAPPDVPAPPDAGAAPVGRRRWLRPAVWALAAVVGLGLVAYGALWLSVGPQVPRGATVAGVPVGGLSRPEAVARLDALDTGGLVVSVDGVQRRLSAPRLGLSFDPDGSVAAAGSRAWNPIALVGQWLRHDVVPAVDVDEQALGATLRRLARGVDNSARQGRITYDGTQVVTVMPRQGLELDESAAAALITRGFPQQSGVVVLPLRTVAPEVSAAEVQRVASGLAVSAVAAPVVLRVAGEDVEIPPPLLAANLTFVPRDGTLVPDVDGAGLHEALADQLAPVEKPAKDAAFDVSSGRPKVVAAKAGFGVGDDELARGVSAVLGAPAGERVVDLDRVPLAPDLTTKQAKQLGVKRVVSSYTQYFPYAAYRVTNIGLAAKKIDETILQPGDTFSLNGIVGERTPENGFVKGYVIGEGNELIEDYGGAVSTITTATWHTAFFAGMTRLEQRAHGFWISRYTPGLEATVSWGSLDLRFRNDTPYGVLVTTAMTSESVTVTMWSTKYWDITAEFGPRTGITGSSTVYSTAPNCVAQEGVDGFDITVTRVWGRDGEAVRKEPLSTSYDPAPTVICGPKPTPKPTTKPSAKPSPSPKPSGSGTAKPSPSPKPSGGG
jgi:vancomycin resistance protein YoaR